MARTHTQRSLPSYFLKTYVYRLLPLSISYLFLSSLVTARLVNITVDDSNPDPLTGATFTYSPADRWARGNGCGPCTAKLDPSKVHDATWHDATYDSTSPGKAEVQTANFPFNGTAFYVYGVLSESNRSPNSTADITFFIDGQSAGNFQYTPPGIPNSYVYNYLLWYTDSLPLGQHTFALQNGRAGGNLSLILLDYAIYTRDDGIPDTSAMSSSTSSSSSESAGTTGTQSPPPTPPLIPGRKKDSSTNNSRMIIIACVVSFSLVAIAAVAFVLYRRHHKRQARQQAQWDNDLFHDEDGPEITPFVTLGGVPGQMGNVSSGPLSGSSAYLTSGYPESTSQLHSGLLQSAAISTTKGDGHESPPSYDSLQVPTPGR